jgi:hypothetical protein
LIARIKEVAAHSERTLAYLRSVEAEIKDNDGLFFPYLTVRSGLIHSEASLRWAREVLSLLDTENEGKEKS